MERRRTRRTNQCWSDNGAIHLVSTSGGSPHWTTNCATASSESRRESGAYSTSLSGNSLTLREETTYDWDDAGVVGACHAKATRVIAYERVEESPLNTAPDAAVSHPLPPPDAAVSHPLPPPDAAVSHVPPVQLPPPPERCVHVGPAARVELSPARKDVVAGSRVCFRTRLVDAHRCEVPDTHIATRWTVRVRGRPVDDLFASGCLTLPAESPATEYLVTVQMGTFSADGKVSVVTQAELSNLIAAQIVEDEPDAGLFVVDAATTVPSGIGGGTVAPVVHENAVPPRTGTPWGTILVLALSGAFAAIAAALLLRKKERKVQIPTLDELDVPLASPRTEKRVDVLPPTAIGLAMVETVSAPAQPVQRRDALPAPTAKPVEAAAARPAPVVTAAKAPNPSSSSVAGTESYVAPAIDESLTRSRVVHEMPAFDIAKLNAPVLEPVVKNISSTDASGNAARQTADRQLSRRCPTCARELAADVLFCPRDGTPIPDPKAREVAEEIPAPAVLSVVCPTCHEAVAPGARFCPRDGTAVSPGSLPLRCPNCDRRFSIGTAFCGEDGSSLVSV